MTRQQMKSALGRKAFLRALCNMQAILGVCLCMGCKVAGTKVVTLPAGVGMSFIQKRKQKAIGLRLEGGKALVVFHLRKQGGSASG